MAPRRVDEHDPGIEYSELGIYEDEEDSIGSQVFNRRDEPSSRSSKIPEQHDPGIQYSDTGIYEDDEDSIGSQVINRRAEASSRSSQGPEEPASPGSVLQQPIKLRGRT